MFWWRTALFALVFASQIPVEATNTKSTASQELFPTTTISDSSSTSQKVRTGKLSRRAKAAQKRLAPRESQVGARKDTSSRAADLAAIRALPRDSSARIAQFHYVRKDKPVVDGKYHKEHPLFLAAPSVIRYQDALDTSKWVYRLRRTVEENDSRIPTDLAFEEYSSLRLKQSIRQNWESMAQLYQLETNSLMKLGDLMGKITKIEVPIPKNPIFSIFGPSIVKLNVNGSINIQAGFRTTKSDLYIANPTGESQSTPSFKQEIQVNVNGEIGDKLKIDADWNTQRTFEYENQLHVKYTGYEDEIVQSVEAGNVSLPTNSSFISGGSALFGIMAKFQVGPLRLTTVATQKKGQVKELTASGGGETKNFEIRPTEYSTNHFWIDTSYIGLYENWYLNDIGSGFKKIQDIEVWVSSTASVTPQGARYIVALMDQSKVENLQKDSIARSGIFNQDPGEIEVGDFIKLERGPDYELDETAGVISLRTSLQQNQAIAVNYVTGTSDFDISPKRIGNSGLEQKDTLKLIMKLVRPRILNNTVKTAWRLMLKNRYPLYITGIDQNFFNFNIEYQLSGQPAQQYFQNISLLEIFGLDRYQGNSNIKKSDNKFDYTSKTIDAVHGEIIFPTERPFDFSSIKKFLLLHGNISDSLAGQYAASLAFPAIYDTSQSVAINDPRNIFYLRGSVKGAGSASFPIGFNSVEGSVVVTSGGQVLTPGVDYTVDYISSKVVIKNQQYLAPGRDIQIKYEANDMFQLASKSLVGARGELNLGKNSLLGFTIMNYSQQSLSDKVRLGEEPISNMIMGMDGHTLVETPWLTNALNFLPGMKTMAPSQITLGGEVAYMLPNPNTRTSPISSDGSKGVAYIDDFEGARQNISLGEIFTEWTDASAPWYSPNLDALQPGGSDGRTISTKDTLIGKYIMSDIQKMEYKARATWFNVNPSDLSIPMIWGDRKKFASGEGTVSALNFYFRPQLRGAFNYSLNLENTIGLNNDTVSTHKNSWAGIQHVLGTTSTDLIDQNIAFIELWINIVGHQDDQAKLNIDLGYISEDVIPNGTRNTEDGLDSPTRDTRRGILNPAYDWGLDTMGNATEIEYFTKNGFLARYPQYAADPSGDNGVGGAENLPKGRPLVDMSEADLYDNSNGSVNGTENNSKINPRPDDEDLNGNKSVDKVNSYFEYEIPLDNQSLPFQKFVTGTGKNQWYQIRIPLSDYKRKIGEPTLSSVEGIRLWVTGASQPMLFRIVDFNLVGNQWEKRVKTDSSYEIGVVNIEDNPNYSTPPGVTQQLDRSRPDQQILGNEQSLSIIDTNLVDGKEIEAVKSFVQKPLVMINYRTLKMFVHGETGLEGAKGYRKFKYEDTSKYDAEVFIRFGDNISNYYEYRAPIHEGWSGNDIVIKFAELTALKAARDSSNVLTWKYVTGGPPGAKYQVIGDPSLESIKFISIGMKNPEGKGVDNLYGSISGEVWANELRLTDVDDTPGWAYKFDTKITLADFGNIAFSFSEQDPFFHRLEDPFGSRVTNRSWTFSTDLNLAKFLPDSWEGSSLGVSYSHTEGIRKRRYIEGTDILVEDAAKRVATETSSSSTRQYKNADDVRLKAEDLTVTNSYSVPAIKLIVPIKSWLVTETINKVTLKYNYSNSFSRSPATEYENSWNWTAGMQYGTEFNKNNFLSPFSPFADFFLLRPWKNFKIFFTPQRFSFDIGFMRSQTRSKSRVQLTPNAIQRSFTSARSMSFDWQFFEGGLFDFGIGYSMNVSSDLSHLETEGENSIQRTFSAMVGDIFMSDRLINFGIDQRYGQTISLKSKISAPQVFSLEKIFTPRMDYSSNYNWANNQNSIVLGKTAGWTASPSFALDVDLKPISEALWPSKSTSKSAPADTGKGIRLNKILNYVGPITRILFKYPFFDFEKFNVTFTQTNTSDNNGVGGGTGFANIFARIPFVQSSLESNGPSLLYQLGFISDPNGRMVLKTKGTFPFITGYTVPGLRVPSLDLTDTYSQRNQIALQTSRSLLDGVTLDLKWNVSWDYSQMRSSRTDALGRPSLISNNTTGGFDRSYLSLPPILMFKFFNTNLETVNKKFEALKSEKGARSDAEKISQAFEEGLEALPWLSKIVGTLAPRANWSIRWTGLESFSLFKSFAKSVSLEHSYSSNYTQRWKMTPGTGREITSQSVSSGFAPLLGVNIVFIDLAKGSLNAKFSFNTTTAYNLVPSQLSVEENSGSQISVSTTYSRQGFEIPFLGVALMNNIDIAFNYSYIHNARLGYDFRNFQKDGSPITGDNTTKLGPTIGYTMSERVTIRLFYTYSRTKPDAGGSVTPGSTTTEGGLDVTIAIK
jgi:cell surface protein SprA